MANETARKRRQRWLGRRKHSERSFTLVESVVAIGIMMYIILEVTTANGTAITLHDFRRDATQASLLASRVLNRVEYYWKTKEFTELDVQQERVPFEEFSDPEQWPRYSYSIDIKPWDFPFVELLTSTFGGGEDGDGGGGEASPQGGLAGALGEGGLDQLIEGIVDQVFGDEPQFMTATATVYWSEEVANQKLSITYLLTNQAKVDQAVVALKGVYDKATASQRPKSNKRKSKKNKKNKGNNPGTDSNAPRPPGNPSGN